MTRLRAAALAWALPALARDAAATRTTTVAVTIGKPTEFRFTLSKRAVRRGTVVFKVTNRGTLAHDFQIAGKKTKRLGKGATATLRVVFRKAGRYPYKCTVPGHAAAGMKGVLKVT